MTFFCGPIFLRLGTVWIQCIVGCPSGLQWRIWFGQEDERRELAWETGLRIENAFFFKGGGVLKVIPTRMQGTYALYFYIHIHLLIKYTIQNVGHCPHTKKYTVNISYCFYMFTFISSPKGFHFFVLPQVISGWSSTNHGLSSTFFTAEEAFPIRLLCG